MTTKQKHKFINRCDSDIITEIMEEQMIPAKIAIERFRRLYQAKHKQKYGSYLQVK